jgi:hypothetical protein
MQKGGYFELLTRNQCLTWIVYQRNGWPELSSRAGVQQGKLFVSRASQPGPGAAPPVPLVEAQGARIVARVLKDAPAHLDHFQSTEKI